MFCPHCHTPNPDEAKYCLRCGSRVRRPCPSCGFLIPLQRGNCPVCHSEIRGIKSLEGGLIEWDKIGKRAKRVISWSLRILIVVVALALFAFAFYVSLFMGVLIAFNNKIYIVIVPLMSLLWMLAVLIIRRKGVKRRMFLGIIPVEYIAVSLFINIVAFLLSWGGIMHYLPYFTLFLGVMIPGVHIMITFIKDIFTRKQPQVNYLSLMNVALFILIVSYFDVLGFTFFGRACFGAGFKFTLDPSSREINRLGFRGPPVSSWKEEGDYRIICMGDSATYGLFLEEENTYARVLEGLLNESGEGNRFEVINAGIPSFTISDGLRCLHNYIPLNPDIIILYYGVSEMYGLYPLEKYKKDINTLLDTARRNNINVILMTYPTGKGYFTLGLYNRVVKEVAKANEVPMIDLEKIFKGQDKKWYWYLSLDRIHPGKRGHRLIADELYRTISENLKLQAPSTK